MLITLPTLIMIPGVLINGKLIKMYSMRSIMIVAWIIFGLAGMSLFFINNIFWFLFMRGVMGFAIGLCQPSSRALPAKLFEGNERSKLLGYITMGGGIISVILSLAFGRLGLISWRYPLWFYPSLAALFIILALIFIPKLPPEKYEEEKKETSLGLKDLGRPVWFLCLAGLYVYTIGAVIQIKTSIHVAELGIGSTDYASYISALNTAGIIVGGFFFGELYKRMKRWLFPVCAVITGIAYYFFATTTSFAVLAVSGFVVTGASIGLLMAYLITRATFVAPKPLISLAVLMVTFSNYLGQFLTTYYVEIIESMFGRAASVSLFSVAIAYLILAGISLVYIFATRKDDEMLEARQTAA